MSHLKGKKQSPEHVAKRAAAVWTPERRAAHAEKQRERCKANVGWTHTEEVKQKLRDLKTGSTLSEETKKKISLSLVGRPCPTQGRPISAETRAKISAAGMGRKPTEETRIKLKARWDKFRAAQPVSKTEGGYSTVFDPRKPYGRSQEHRVIMEAHLGRDLTTEEKVHHVNGLKDENKISNLHLCANNSEHRKCHASLEKVAFQLVREKVICFKDGEYFKCPEVEETTKDK